jgi:hypothetical protein
MIRFLLAALLLSSLAPGPGFSQAQEPGTKTPPVAAEPAVPPAPEAASAPAAAEPGKDAGPEATPRETLRDSIQPPDGEDWLIDAEGRSYYVRKHAKSLPYKRIGESRIRIVYGAEFDLAGEDQDNLWLKVYRPNDNPIVRPPAVHIPTAEELAASAATFETRTANSDRLRLKPFDAGLPTRGLWRNGFDLADLTGDGELDIVHGPPRRGGDQPRVFAGDGHGTWRPFRAVVPSGLLDYGDAKVADFNSDGKPDLAFASHLRGITVFLGDGAGNFSDWRQGLDFDAPRPGYDGKGFSSRRLEVLDWNKDGKPDLLALSEGPRISITGTGSTPKVSGVDLRPDVFGPKLYLNQGDGTWVALAEDGARREIFGDDLAVADFSPKGNPGFLTSSNAMGRTDLLYLQGDKIGGPWAPADLPVRPRAYVSAVAVADFDRDRRPDIAVTYISFELGVNRVGLDIYLSRREGKWERRPVFVRDGRESLTALEAGDLDGDKAADLVATDHDGFLLLFLGDGKGGFSLEASPEAQQPRGPCRGYGLKMADIDRDGRQEIVASYAGEADAIFDPHRCPGQGGMAAWTLESTK